MSKPITVKEEREMLLLDPDPDKTKLEAALEDNALYSINIDAFFKGEIIRSDQSFMMKLESLFHGVRVRSAKVTRIGDRTEYQAVVDKDAFLSLIRHNSYGVFRGDYRLEITDFCVNEGDIIVTPESPLKLAPAKKEVDGLDQELTITMRRGKEPTDRPAPGMQTFNLMTDPNEVFRILEHFELEGKVTRCTKATPQRPTLQIRLTDSVEKLFTEEYHKEPCLVYNPSPQSVATGATQLWAHMHISSQNLPKRVVIEGIDGLVDLEEVKHRLSYQGEVISDLEKMVWKDPQMRFTNVANGDICVFMKIRVEFNYLLFGRDSYKVSYQNQPLQCSICYSFSHRATSCDKRHIGRATLHFDYLSKWKRQVGFIERRSRHRSSSSSESPDGENASGDDGSNESDGEPDAKSLDDTVVNNQGSGNAQEAQTENDLRSSVRLDISSPAQILEKFEEAYETADEKEIDDANKTVTVDENAREEPVDAEKDGASEKVKPSAQAVEVSDELPTDSANEGWEQVKPRKYRSSRSSGNDSDSSYNSAPDATNATSQKGTSTRTQNKKRKPDSPKENNIKHTGSGRKKAHFAEKTKSVFYVERNKKHDEALDAGNSVVKKEKLKRDLTSMEEKYYKLLFENETGSDPDAKENWDEIKRALSETRDLLEKKSKNA